MHRRRFLKFAATAAASRSMRAQSPPLVLPPWQPGILDIHHLAYGRGNSTFILCPDGSTMLIDAGNTDDSLAVSCPQKPNASQTPGEWIAEYALRHMQPAGRRELDFALLTHIHPDHIDAISDVDAHLPIRTLIDRGFPDYSYPPPPQAPFTTKYLAYVRARQDADKHTERVTAGGARQMRLLRDPDLYPTFSIRNIAANGEVWTGIASETRRRFPASADPNENICSIAIRLTYGKFDYFTGGDLTSDTEESGELWRDMETPAAHAAGPVEVAVANHHAYFDATGPNFVRELRPRVFIIPSWYIAHPAVLPLRRMLTRDVYATCIMQANREVNNQFIRKLKSSEGHIIVRVPPGGGEFQVFVTDNSDDADRVKILAGPYPCN